jgi:hypothetical protein
MYSDLAATADQTSAETQESPTVSDPRVLGRNAAREAISHGGAEIFGELVNDGDGYAASEALDELPFDNVPDEWADRFTRAYFQEVADIEELVDKLLAQYLRYLSNPEFMVKHASDSEKVFLEYIGGYRKAPF